MNKILWFFPVVLILLCSACDVEDAGLIMIDQPGFVEEAIEPQTILHSELNCTATAVREYIIEASLSQLVEEATGMLPSSTNTCWAISNLTHGGMTNFVYITNGWALLNLPVEIFVPWEDDRYLVGGPAEVAALATIDEDTIVVDGGFYSIYIGDNLIDIVDWSAVYGGEYIREVRFESSRLAFENNERYWTAYCNDQIYSGEQLEQALACGRGE